MGYISPEGHDHDDNCVRRMYICGNGHQTILSKRNRCPNTDCDWVGEKTCHCHEGEKVDEWPEAKDIDYPKQIAHILDKGEI